jgi:hypothetical protein
VRSFISVRFAIGHPIVRCCKTARGFHVDVAEFA